MRLVASKVDVFVREIDAFVAPVCTVVWSSLFGVSCGTVKFLGSGILDWNVLLRDGLGRNGLRGRPLLRNALHTVLSWSIWLLWALSVDVHASRFMNGMLWVGVAAGMLDRGVLKWRLSMSVHVNGSLSGMLDWMGDAGTGSMLSRSSLW